MRSTHMRIDIAGAIRNRSFGGFHDDQGRPIPKRQVEAELKLMLARGEKYMLVGDPCDCPNFDPQSGCPGHGS